MRSFAVALAAVAVVAVAAAARPEPAPKADRLFELRTYVTHEGKLEALHKRFRDHTCRLFKKHGIELVGFWTPTDGPASKNTLVYVIAFPDKAAQEKSWKAFLDDLEWKKAFEESHKDGKIVDKVQSTFMAPVDYSPIK